MRVVFAGASPLAVRAAQLLIGHGDEVVIIEPSQERIDALSEQIDCGFLHGDAGKPELLREAAPERTDVLFCLSDDDRANILTSLIGRSLAFRRTVTKIEDEDLEEICLELGLKDTIVPSRTIGRFLADVVRGPQILELSTFIKGQARFFSFKIDPRDAGRTFDDFDLPAGARAICFYRHDEFHLAEPDSKLQQGDEVVILTHSRNLETLRQRWAPETRGEEPSQAATGDSATQA
jgi:trk system potassium uptake protein TrkA